MTKACVKAVALGMVVLTQGARLAGQEAAPQTTISRAVRLNHTGLVGGAEYQLQSSGSLSNWTNLGASFTAPASVATQYLEVVGRESFYRLLRLPSVIRIEQNVPYWFACLPGSTNYFVVWPHPESGNENLTELEFVCSNINGGVLNLFVTRTLPFPPPATFDYAASGAGSASVLVSGPAAQLFNTNDCFITVVNTNSVMMTYGLIVETTSSFAGATKNSRGASDSTTK